MAKLDSEGRVQFDENGNLIPKAQRRKPGTALKYIEGELNVDFIIVENEATTVSKPTMHGRISPGQGADGYGRKISTDMMVQWKDNPKKKRRIFCTCFSNAGSHWIVESGQAVYLGTVFREEIQSEFLPVDD